MNLPHLRKFEGVLTRLDLPSDKAPGGARGHRVILPTEVARAALESLVLAPIGFGECWTVHNFRQRCGVITDSRIEGDELIVRGMLFAADYPEVITVMEKGKLGMSYEIEEAAVVDQRSEHWVLSRVTFRGAAILYADRAAYGTTRISLAAAAAGPAAEYDVPEDELPRISFELASIKLAEE